MSLEFGFFYKFALFPSLVTSSTPFKALVAITSSKSRALYKSVLLPSLITSLSLERGRLMVCNLLLALIFALSKASLSLKSTLLPTAVYGLFIALICAPFKAPKINESFKFGFLVSFALLPALVSLMSKVLILILFLKFGSWLKSVLSLELYFCIWRIYWINIFESSYFYRP